VKSSSVSESDSFVNPSPSNNLPTLATPLSEGRTARELRDQLEHRERQIDAIRRITETLFSHPSVDAMVQATLQTALDVVRADAGTLYLYEPQTDSLVFRYVIGGGGERLIGRSIPASQGIAGTVFRTGQPLLTGNTADSGDFNQDVDKETGYQTESMMTVPVKRSEGAPVGVMQVLNAKVPFTKQDLEVLEVLCAQAATGIEHARLSQEVKRAEIVHVIGDISHDIKNMVTPIITGTWTLEPMLQRLFEQLEELAETCEPGQSWGSELREIADFVRNDYGWLLENVITAAEQVQARTREIADAVKGELAEPYFERADFNERCRAVAQTLKVVASKAGIEIVLDLDSELPLVEFDRKQIYNALYNLVNNAIPYTPSEGRITLRTRKPEDGSEFFLVQVADTGKGMPEHIRVKLFTEDAISTTPGGTGLGTRIVAGVVRRHNGTISVESELGKGTTFSIALPLHHTKEML
jgi:signal transduction histidine kinase